MLADIDNGFAEALERLALKKAANNEVYEHIKTVFDKLRSTAEFKSLNEKNRNQTYVIITSLTCLLM